MKIKPLPKVTFISLLLLSATIGSQLVNSGRANPYIYLGNVPPDSNTEPPEISILSPENNTMFPNNSFFLNFTISVGHSTTGSYLNIYDAGYKADWKQYDQWINPELTEFSFNLTDVPDGNHSIIVHAAEEGSYIPAYNSSNPMTRNDFYINDTSTVFFVVDTTSPKVSILSLENRTYNTPDVSLDFAVSESFSHVIYSLDGKNNVTISGNMTLAGLPNGDHNVTIYATDVAGNTGGSEITYFTVDVPEPFPTTLVVAASIATVAVVGVGLLVYFKKRKN